MPRYPWAGPIAYEGRPTIDGRMIEHGGLTWPAEPLPLFVRNDTAEHLRQREPAEGDYAFPVPSGRIEVVERRADGEIWAAGYVTRPLPAPHLFAAVDAALADVVLRMDPAVLVAASATLYSVWLHYEPQAWPGARLVRRG